MSRSMTERSLRFEIDGFLLVPSGLTASELASLRHAVDALSARPSRGGVRHLLSRLPEVRRIALDARLVGLATELLGAAARPVKATLFDKRPDANWNLSFHQDTVVAVRRRAEVRGFGPWTVKDGIPHAGAPAEVLERMVALRLHLDDTPEENGALRVVPGSHRSGRLDRSAAARLRGERGEVSSPARAGELLAMRPLLLHASSASESPSRRRVIHIEYAAGPLPPPLEWAA